jgi:glucose/arabinose dehydrogenase
LLTMTACSESSAAHDTSTNVTTLATNLDVPWGMSFLPNGNALVTQRDQHTILQVTPRGAVSTLQTIPGVSSQGETGLLGIAVSPQYTNDSSIFVYYSTAQDNRIARLRPGQAPQPIVTGIPTGHNRNGGKLAFGPDGYLYAGTGDAGDTSHAQEIDKLGGKVLRMTMDGKAPPNNPFPKSLVYAYGYRNVQGLAWDRSGRLYASDFGEDKADELNRVEAGKDYGWPIVEGKSDDPRYVSPLATWAPAQASPSGIAISGSTVALACLRGEQVRLVGLDGNGNVSPKARSILGGKFGRLRAIEIAPDGSPWITTSNKDDRGSPHKGDDKILRIPASAVGKR